MLAKSQNQPFKHTIDNLKKIKDYHSIQKEQNHIKSTLKTLTQVTDLNEFLKILIDSHWFIKLSKILQKSVDIFSSQGQIKKNFEMQQDWLSSPSKSVERSKFLMLKSSKHIDLTSSTKKSRVMSNATMANLIEDLIDSLQKFDQIRQNSKRIKLLVEQIYDEIQCDYDTQNGDDDKEEINLEKVWGEISLWRVEDVSRRVDFPLCEEKIPLFFELIKHLQTICKFTQMIKFTTHQLCIFMEPSSIDQQDNQSRDSFNLQAVTKKSNNPSSHRSLLTEVLQDSSQQSNLQIENINQYCTQVILRPRMKLREYSQNQNEVFLDQDFKLSYKSAKPYSKIHHKFIKSDMDYNNDDNREDVENRPNHIKKKEVKAKKSEMGCSRCEIF